MAQTAFVFVRIYVNLATKLHMKLHSTHAEDDSRQLHRQLTVTRINFFLNRYDIAYSLTLIATTIDPNI